MHRISSLATVLALAAAVYAVPAAAQVMGDWNDFPTYQAPDPAKKPSTLPGGSQGELSISVDPTGRAAARSSPRRLLLPRSTSTLPRRAR